MIGLEDVCVKLCDAFHCRNVFQFCIKKFLTAYANRLAAAKCNVYVTLFFAKFSRVE